jgi:hypothetical protein
MLLFVAMSAELSLANPCIPPRFQMEGRPPWMGALLHYLRVYQTWGMFSADAPLEDGVVVVDAVLADGSHLDPLTDRAPDFDAFSHGPWYPGHDWSEYMSYIPWERHRAYRDGLLQHVLRSYESRGHPAEKEIRSLDIIWLSAQSPSPGGLSDHDIKRELLVSYVAPEPATNADPTNAPFTATPLISHN